MFFEREIPLACGEVDSIHKIKDAMEKCFLHKFEVYDINVGVNGQKKNLSSLYAKFICESFASKVVDDNRPSMVYVVRTFIDRYGLNVDGGEYTGYVAPDPNKLTTLGGRTIEDCIKWKNIDEIFGKGVSEKSMQ